MHYNFKKGDCLKLLQELPENSIDACITDPPYGITFMGREWDKGLPSAEIWQATLRVVKPGGSLMAFGGTRTFHRLACNIEDGGWEIKDTISWMYGQGFPKSMNLAKAIDKAERGCPQGGHDPLSPNAGKFKGGCSADSPLGRHHGAGPGNYMKEQGVKDDRELCEKAMVWNGWGTALKPAWEPIIWAIKPLDGTYVNNLQKWDVAGINIDETRIQYQSEEDKSSATPQGICRSKPAGSLGAEPNAGRQLDRKEFERPELKGRFPSNVVLTHHPECKYLGSKKIKAITGGGGEKKPGKHGVYGKFDGHHYDGKLGYFNEDGTETVESWECHDDCPIKLLDNQKEVSRFFYSSKASRKERNVGCEQLYWHKNGKEFNLIDKDAWNELPNNEKAIGNIHTTVKPLQLMEYLCKMVKMPQEITILDPFCGSGTTGVAALTTGSNFIGFDNDNVAAIISEARLSNILRSYV